MPSPSDPLADLPLATALTYGSPEAPTLRVSCSTSFNVVASQDYCEKYPRVTATISRDDSLGRLVVTVTPAEIGYTWSQYLRVWGRVTIHKRLADGKLARGIGKNIPDFTLTDAELVELDPVTGVIRAVMPSYDLLLPPRKIKPHKSHAGRKKPLALPVQRVQQAQPQPSTSPREETSPNSSVPPEPYEYERATSLPPVSFAKAQPTFPSLDQLRAAARTLRDAKLAQPNDVHFRLDALTGMLSVTVSVDLLS